MRKIAQRVSDKRRLRLIREFLTEGVRASGVRALRVRDLGVRDDGPVSPVEEGTPQSLPLSPLSPNAVLDEWDRALERRGLRFAR